MYSVSFFQQGTNRHSERKKWHSERGSEGVLGEGANLSEPLRPGSLISGHNSLFSVHGLFRRFSWHSLARAPLQKCVGDLCCIKILEDVLGIFQEDFSGHFFPQT